MNLDELKLICLSENEKVQRLKNLADGSFPDEKWLPNRLRTMLIEESNRPDEKRHNIALIKFFNPCGIGTWYLTSFDPERGGFFGLCDLGDPELGYLDEREIRELRVPPFNLPIERDLWFAPVPLEELVKR